jgi:hypothetical protein
MTPISQPKMGQPGQKYQAPAVAAIVISDAASTGASPTARQDCSAPRIA